MATAPTPADVAAEAAHPPRTPKEATIEMLKTILTEAEDGKVQGVVVGYLLTSGGANVVSTAMSPVMMNHIHRLLDERVSREYRRAMQAAQQAQQPRAPTGPVPTHAGAKPDNIPGLPRKVRRQLQAAAKRANKRASRGRQTPTQST